MNPENHPLLNKLIHAYTSTLTVLYSNIHKHTSKFMLTCITFMLCFTYVRAYTSLYIHKSYMLAFMLAYVCIDSFIPYISLAPIQVHY